MVLEIERVPEGFSLLGRARGIIDWSERLRVDDGEQGCCQGIAKLQFWVFFHVVKWMVLCKSQECSRKTCVYD